ncbi:MAG: beta-lactamase hydrolase domain-containing protein [Candidatus Methylomirabilales bacterium]
MEDRIRISHQLTVGSQPTEGQLKQFAEEGFKSVVNLRISDEEDQPLSPDEEGVKVRSLGMEYLHIPISKKAIQPEQVDSFRQEIRRLPEPVFVHCHLGKRAGALAMMHTACEAGISGDQTLERAEQMGFKCDVPELKEFVTGYIDRTGK